MRIFTLRRQQAAGTQMAMTPEFGVRVVLRKGDRVVRRTADGAIEITHVTEQHLDLSDVLRVQTPIGRRASR